LTVSKKIAWLVLAFIVVATWVSPIWPYEQGLHTSLTVVGVVVLWWYDKKYALTDVNFILIIAFITVHTIGAYWLYSNVPYDEGFKALFGRTLSEIFGWERNHFDRMVHLLYGFCLTPALMQIIQSKGLTHRVAWIIAISVIMISSLWYEWFEWLVAIGLSPEDAEAYNGQQGDMWDAHKDMALATLGAVPHIFWKNKGHIS
jgi:putative membrane protein